MQVCADLLCHALAVILSASQRQVINLYVNGASRRVLEVPLLFQKAMGLLSTHTNFTARVVQTSVGRLHRDRLITPVLHTVAAIGDATSPHPGGL